MSRKLAGLAVLIVIGMSSLVGVTAGCDLSIDDRGIKSDTTEGGSDPGSPTMMGPADAPELP